MTVKAETRCLDWSTVRSIVVISDNGWIPWNKRIVRMFIGNRIIFLFRPSSLQSAVAAPLRLDPVGQEKAREQPR